MPTLQGKTAIVTGAARGIGKAIACILAKQGATLHLVGRNQSALQEVAAQARSATVHDVNLADDAAMSAFQDAVPAAIGSLDLLIHSAGVIVREESKRRWDALWYLLRHSTQSPGSAKELPHTGYHCHWR